MKDEKKRQPTCPTTASENSDLTGCGSANLDGPDEEGFYDCLDCGLFFQASDATLVDA